MLKGGVRVRLSVFMQTRARASELVPEHATTPRVQRTKGRRDGLRTKAYANAASVGNQWPELQLTTVDVYMVAVTGGCRGRVTMN